MFIASLFTWSPASVHTTDFNMVSLQTTDINMAFYRTQATDTMIALGGSLPRISIWLPGLHRSWALIWWWSLMLACPNHTNMAPGSSTDHGYQHDFRLQHTSQTSG